MARITFIGAAGVVTGSKHLLETDSGARVLLDCGLFQGMKDLTDRNWTPPPVHPATLTAVLLSHGHLDHCGYLPALVQQGFTGAIYTTAATADVAGLVLADAAHLQEDEAQRAQRHPERGLHAKPLYTSDDVARVCKLFKPVQYGDTRTDIAGCRFRLSDAGHILGSAIIEIWFDKSELTFTGDIGRYNNPLLHDPTAIAESDYVLCESTYGDRLHPPSNPQDDLAGVITAAMQRGGCLVIPAFAIGRTQDILYAIGQLQRAQRIPNVRIFVDSPMSIEADAIMERHPECLRFDPKAVFGPNDTSLGAQNVTLTKSAEDSIKINAVQSGAVIISSSGMVQGGRILHHMRNRLGRQRDTVCFVGYNAPNTMGAALCGGAKSVTIMGVQISVAAAITQIDGFSAHADRDELLRWFGGFQDHPQVYLVHGDSDQAQGLAQAVHDKYGFIAQAAVQGNVVEIP